MKRRTLVLGLGALSVSACGTPARLTPAPSRDPDMIAVPNAGYDAWVASFRTRAASAGVSRAVIDRAFRDAGFLPGVIERDRNQTEFTRTLEDYLSIAASEEKVAAGRAAFARHRTTLSAIEAKYGVEAEIVAAIWGVESNYGTRRGEIPVISALSTLAFDGRRGAFFERQLIAALKILERGDTTPDRMVGSWAGAMGHTQFIPTSYQAYAVDFTGDGRRDIWSDDPADALASAAAYLSRFGWRHGSPWAVEAEEGTDGTLIQPQPGGPSFRVHPNFNVIKRYNNSTSYALGVSHLANRIAGGGPIRGSFPPDAYGMTREMRQDLQRRLTAAGYDTGGTDGVIGPKSRSAISGFQSARGLPVTGDPSPQLLALLR